MKAFVLSLLVFVTFSGEVLSGNPPKHWSFPGQLNTHLNGHHKASTVGLTYEEMLNLHDKIHIEELNKSTTKKVTRFRIFRKGR